MRIKVTKWLGSQSDGIVLSTCGSIIRVAIPGCDDSVEFSYRWACWFSEDGEPVEIEFLPTKTNGRDFGSALDDRAADRWLGSCRIPASAWVN